MKKMRKLLLMSLVAALLFGVFTMQALAGTDDTALQTVIDKFEALDENVYTPATYRLAKMEYDRIKELIDDSESTQNEIDDAINALNTRIAALKVRNGSESLWRTYQDYFELGNIYSSPGNLDPNNTRGLLTSTHFNSLTAENNMKPESLSTGGAGQPGTFRIFEGSNHASDQLVRLAQENDMKVHGHVLVWHSQTPGWVNGGTFGNYTRSQAKENMEYFIKTVVEHFDTYYPGVVASWDVVNEAFIDEVPSIPEDANWKDYLRKGNQSGWYKAYSNGMLEHEEPSDFLYDAFVFARKYTDAKLFYNDFNMYEDGKSKLVAMMAIELNDRYRNEYPEDPRQLIEGLGMQSHNYIMDTPPSSVENGILNLLSAGIDIGISELDLFAWYPWNAEPSTGYRDLKDRGVEHIIGSTGTEEQRNYWINRSITNGSDIEVIQAEVYAEYFQIYKKYAEHIDRVTFWGLADNQSWRRGHNPLLWNSDFSPKDAFYAVSDPEGYLGGGEAEQEGAYLTGQTAVESGTSFDLTLNISAVTDSVYQNVYGQDFTIVFDPNVLIFEEAESLIDGLVIVGSEEVSPGEIRFLTVALGEGQGIPANGKFVSFTFVSKPASKQVATAVSVDHVILANSTGQELGVQGSTFIFDVTVKAVDKSDLNALIALAQSKLDAAVEGNEDGQHVIGSKALLQAAIDQAQAIADQATATQQQIDQAEADLTLAIEAFESSRISVDVNEDGKVSVGDLAIVAAGYGKKSTDSDWEQYKASDVNKDGVIDIDDLTAVAKKILE